MASILETLTNAFQHYQVGHLSQAAQLYYEILQQHPNQTDALQMLGIIATQSNNYGLAIEWFSKAIKENPLIPSFYYNLGNVLQAQGQQAEAIAHYAQALTLNPNYAEAHNNLGLILEKQGNLEAAILHYQQAIALLPQQAELYNNLGLALKKQGKLEAAITSYQQAIVLQPNCAKFYKNLACALQQQQQLEEAIAHYQQAIALQPYSAELYNWLGIALQQQQLLEEAIAHYQQAIALQPYCLEFHCNLASALKMKNPFPEVIAHYQQALTQQPNAAEIPYNKQNTLPEKLCLEEAIAYYQQVLTLRPSYAEIYHILEKALEAASAHYQQVLTFYPNAPEVHTNLGNVLREQSRWEAAISHYQQALALNPNYLAAHENLGVVFIEQGQPQVAIEQYQQALTLKPNHPIAHYNLSFALLVNGDIQRGFTEYEWRWQKEDNPARIFSQPLWDGSSLEEKTILLHGEQGLGDQIQFIRYVPLVAQHKGRIVVECTPPLVRLFSSVAGIDQLVARGEVLPTFDVHAPLMSLPRILGTTLETVPAQIPYLCSTTSIPLKLETPPNTRLKVGIVWAGNPLFKGNYKRFCSLEYFLKLLNVPNIAFYSLQTGPQAKELTQISPSSGAIQDLSCQLGDFADTALVLERLDLVISVDTAVAHLAGALGKPAWVLLSFSPDWRWMLKREDSPWYPTIRLFRQSQPGDWSGVFERVEKALLNTIGSSSVNVTS